MSSTPETVIIERLRQKHNQCLEETGLTPNCFAFALDAAFGGRMFPSYEKWSRFDGPIPIEIETELELATRGEFGTYSAGVLSLLIPLDKIEAVRKQAADQITQSMISDSSGRRVILTVPGLSERVYNLHARSLVPNSQEILLADSLDPELVRSIPVRAARNEILHSLIKGTVYTLGFRVNLFKIEN